MMRIKPWVAGVGLCVAVMPAAALNVLLDFESIPYGTQILDFYEPGVTFLSAPSSPFFSSGDRARAVAYGNLETPSELFAFSAIEGVPATPTDPHPLAASKGVMSSNDLTDPTPGAYAQMDSAASFELAEAHVLVLVTTGRVSATSSRVC